MSAREHVRGLETLDSGDVGLVGGKNASLGEMIQHLREAGVRVPEGFATTAQAYWDFLEANALEERIGRELNRLKDREQSLSETGHAVRTLFLESEFPREIAGAIIDAYAKLAERIGREDPDVAVRSSATAEDLPEASFAGQQETYLNIRGERALLDA